MLGAVFCDLLNGITDVFNRFHRHFIVQKFCSEACFVGFFQQIIRIFSGKNFIGWFIGVDYHILFSHPDAEFGKIGQPAFMQNQAVQRIANAYTAGFGIENNVFPFFQITGFIKIGMADTGAGFDNGNLRILAYKIYQTLSATRNYHIHRSHRTHQFSSCFTTSREQCHNIFIQIILFQHFFYHIHNGQIGIVGIATTFQHTGIARFEAERKYIKTHVWTGFVYYADHTERNRNFCDLHTVRSLGFHQCASERRRKFGHIPHVRSNCLHSFRCQLQPVVKRISRLHFCQIIRIGFDDFRTVSFDFIGQN